jgi:PAS domain S-box-containing protein
MSRLSNELLLALAYVSRIPDSGALRLRFFESLSEIAPAYSFEYSAAAPREAPGLDVMPIATLHSAFGFALVRRPSRLDPDASAESAVFRNAFQFLAILLENRAQARALAADKACLEGEVARVGVQVREQEERYRSIFENRHVVMLLIEPGNERIVDANPAAVAFYGYSRDLLLSMRVADLNVEGEAEVRERLRLAAAREKPYFCVQHRLADGSVRDVEIYTGPIAFDGTSLLFSIVHDVSARAAAEAELESSLEEKDVLLKELHHRVKNNLQIVSSMLSLQIGSPSGSAAEPELLKAQNRIHVLALLHEMLYQSDRVDRLDLGRYLRSIVATVIESCGSGLGGLGYEVEIDPLQLGIDKAIPCGLIVNELITNVIKHAFAEKAEGHFAVEARRLDGGRISLAVSDDGLPAARPAGPERRESHAGIGLQLVEALVLQLDGVMTVGRERGTRVEIVFPEGLSKSG